MYCWHALLGYWGGAQLGKATNSVLVDDGVERSSHDTLPRLSKALLEVEPQLEWEPWAWTKIGVGAYEGEWSEIRADGGFNVTPKFDKHEIQMIQAAVSFF